MSGDWIVHGAPGGGVELLRAWFAGRAYARHRHDTYAVCVTETGLQAFDYRGATRISSVSPLPLSLDGSSIPRSGVARIGRFRIFPTSGLPPRRRASWRE